MFGEKPKKTRIPLVAGDHPETDLSEFCDQDQIKQFQMVVGQLIWITGLGRFDIVVHVMTKSLSSDTNLELDTLQGLRGSLVILPTSLIDS